MAGCGQGWVVAVINRMVPGTSQGDNGAGQEAAERAGSQDISGDSFLDSHKIPRGQRWEQVQDVHRGTHDLCGCSSQQQGQCRGSRDQEQTSPGRPWGPG